MNLKSCISKSNKSLLKFEVIFLILLVLATFGIRFYNTGELSNGDDSEYAQLAMHIIEDPLRAIYPSFPDEPMSYDNMKYNRPLAATPIVPFIFIFGYTNTAVKLPSIIFACLSVVLLYFILKKQFNSKIAYIASILFAFNPFHILFSRAGFLHSALVFYILLTILLIEKYFETKKQLYIYIASFICLANMWTTDFRGVLPLLSLIPYVFLKTRIANKKSENLMFYTKELKHFISAAFICIMFYLIYMLIPIVLWNDYGWFNWFEIIFSHSLGINPGYTRYKPFIENIILMGKYLIVTPFLGLIIIPFFFGIFKSIRSCFVEKKNTANNTAYFLWFFYLLTSLLYYINKQPYVERQTVYTPVYVTFAAIGIYYAYSKFVKEKSPIITILLAMVGVYSIIILKLFPSLFAINYRIHINKAGIIPNLLSIGDHYFLLIILFIILIALLIHFLMIILKLNIQERKKIGTFLVVFFLLINILVASFLVCGGVGIYKRPDAIKVVSDFLSKNTKNAKYSCIAYNEDKAITFYTQKICVNYKQVELEWLKEQVAKGNIKYFVLNKYEQIVGYGLETRADIHKYFPDLYEWIMNNTKDITTETGLSDDNPYYRIRIAN